MDGLAAPLPVLTLLVAILASLERAIDRVSTSRVTAHLSGVAFPFLSSYLFSQRRLTDMCRLSYLARRAPVDRVQEEAQ